ncbi:hypothetical protein GY15_03470 [Delftia sp. 670]|nr:hypothetical protein GY15_03470 [Delftia sp. 670]
MPAGAQAQDLPEFGHQGSAQLELGQALEMGQGFEVQVRLRMYGVQVVGQIQQFADAIEGGACAFGAEFLGLARLRDRAAGDDGAQHIGLGEIGNHGIPLMKIQGPARNQLQPPGPDNGSGAAMGRSRNLGGRQAQVHCAAAKGQEDARPCRVPGEMHVLAPTVKCNALRCKFHANSMQIPCRFHRKGA